MEFQGIESLIGLDVSCSGAVVSVAADANRTLLAPSCVEPSAIVAGSTSNASPGHNFSVIFSRPEITTKATPYVVRALPIPFRVRGIPFSIDCLLQHNGAATGCAAKLD